MNIKSTILLLLPTLLFSGCTREDMSECYTQTGIQISVSYENEVSSPLLRRSDIYLFDAEGRFVTQQSEQNISDGTNITHTIYIPEGNYTVVAWGNIHNSVKITPTDFVVGQTTIEQARLSLAEFAAKSKTDNIIYTTGPEKELLHAIKRDIQVTNGQKNHITMSLFRNTKHINVSVRAMDINGDVCEHTTHRLNTVISGSDAILNFENSLHVSPEFFYQPLTQNNITGGFDASFNKMRLFIGESSDIIFTNPDAAEGQEPFYRKSLMTLLEGTGYNSQERLDGTHIYNLEFRFRCADWDITHITARIFVNGWEYVEMGGGV